MNQSIATVSLLVRDYDEALAFYVGRLGFSLVEDRHMPEPGKRWVTVRPPGGTDGGALLLLARATSPEQQACVGNQTGGRVFLFLHTDDFWRDHRRLQDQGVEFVRAPVEQPYGTVAVFKDLYGNLWDLLQMRRKPEALLFVYGSLKEGFPNFHVNRGRRLPGDFKTLHPHPLWLYQGQLPCLLPQAGAGQQVLGQVFEVTPEELAAMDLLERVGQPGGYRRVALQVLPAAQGAGDAAPFEAFAYVQDPALLEGSGPHVGPIAEYTQEHAQRLRW